jgi:DNA invertase Pin-like site-specific DNA recombinase
MMTRAFSYQRVSGRGQIEGDGFERQRLAIQSYAAQHGIEIVKEFQDEGIRGTKETVDRPALSELLLEIVDDGVRLIVVERADRLARDLIVNELIIQQLAKMGVSVVDASGTDLTVADNDPTKKLIRQILGAFAEFDKSSIVAKLRAARQRKKRATGKNVEGRKPFGTREGEAETLAIMRQFASDGLNSREIAASLNQENRRTRLGRPWNPGCVWAILQQRREPAGTKG